jgi:hypothetical protein
VKNAMERLVPEALAPELQQALVMLYCRMLTRKSDGAALRRLAGLHSDLMAQFDAFDRLHAEFPFSPLNSLSLPVELGLLIEHNRELGSLALCRQLKRLCLAVPALAPWAAAWLVEG